MESQLTIDSDLVTDGEYNELMSVMLADGFCVEQLVDAQQPVAQVENNGDKYGPTGVLPSTEELPGQCGFKLSIKDSPHCSWLYSEDLNQVFTDMDKVLVVTFNFDCTLPGMYIRALPVYTSPDFASTAVIRCKFHQLNDDPRTQAHTSDDNCFCDSHNLAGHVVRADVVDRLYCYNESSGRHSVVVPVSSNMNQSNLNCPTETTSFTVNIPYVFACKTSCKTGMQRRPIKIIFTLEANGVVLGRQVLSVKISSCPKRDKDKMENHIRRQREKRVLDETLGMPPMKKLKIELKTEDNHQNLIGEFKTLMDDLISFIKSWTKRSRQFRTNFDRYVRSRQSD